MSSYSIFYLSYIRASSIVIRRIKNENYLHVAPLGRSAPDIPTESELLKKQAAASAVVAMMCNAQASPPPSSRYCLRIEVWIVKLAHSARSLCRWHRRHFESGMICINGKKDIIFRLLNFFGLWSKNFLTSSNFWKCIFSASYKSSPLLLVITRVVFLRLCHVIID